LPDATESLVADRLAQETSVAQRIADGVSAQGRDVDDATIRAFFPELNVRHGGHRTNIVRDVSLPHQLVCGSPVVVNLEPMSASEFESRYRITLSAAERFAEQGHVIANLYVRDPAAWRGFSHFERLIRLSLANGVRVDKYFTLRNAQFASLIDDRADQLDRQLRQVQQSRPQDVAALLTHAKSQRGAFGRVIGTRWAYLDVLAPQASDVVAGLVSECRLAEALEFLRLTKHAVVSPISSALGGEFRWAPSDLGHIRLESEQSLTERRTVPFADRGDAMEFLIHSLTTVAPFRCLREYEADTLAALMANSDLEVLKAHLCATMEAMAALAQRGEVRESSVNDWIRVSKEIQRVLGQYEKVGQTAANVTAVTVGCIVQASIEGAAGFVVGVAAGALATEVLGKRLEAGRAVHRLVNPGRHRFILALEKLQAGTRAA